MKLTGKLEIHNAKLVFKNFLKTNCKLILSAFIASSLFVIYDVIFQNYNEQLGEKNHPNSPDLHHTASTAGYKTPLEAPRLTELRNKPSSYRLKNIPTLLVFDDSMWAEESINKRWGIMQEVFKQCGLEVPNIPLNEDMRKYDMFLIKGGDSSNLDMANLKRSAQYFRRILPEKKAPLVIFGKNLLIKNKFGMPVGAYGVAVSRRHIGRLIDGIHFNEKTVDIVFLSDQRIVGGAHWGENKFSSLAHELFHIFCGCGHIEEESIFSDSKFLNLKEGREFLRFGNLMTVHGEHKSNFLNDLQCKTLVAAGQNSGFIVKK